MAAVQEASAPIWLAEIHGGEDIWQRHTDNFYNSGEQAIVRYLARDRGYTCYACPEDDHWTVQLIGLVAEDRPWTDMISVYTAGESILAALAVAAGALEAIRDESVFYTISAECCGVTVW